jgi:hypothetical protein
MKPKPKFRTIKWEDHHSDSSWKNSKEMAIWASKPNICTTKGWVTFENKNVIVLSASFDGDESYGENMCILKKNITK